MIKLNCFLIAEYAAVTAEGAGILMRLGFIPPTKPTGTHRRFRIEIDDPADETKKLGIVIGLVEKGRGTLKPKYISVMVRTLKENKLLPPDVE